MYTKKSLLRRQTTRKEALHEKFMKTESEYIETILKITSTFKDSRHGVHCQELIFNAKDNCKNFTPVCFSEVSCPTKN